MFGAFSGLVVLTTTRTSLYIGKGVSRPVSLSLCSPYYWRLRTDTRQTCAAHPTRESVMRVVLGDAADSCIVLSRGGQLLLPPPFSFVLLPRSWGCFSCCSLFRSFPRFLFGAMLVEPGPHMSG